jgi:hypothetical protein
VHLLGVTYEERCIAGGQIAHAHALPPDSDAIQQVLGLLDPFLGPEVPTLEMAVAFTATHHINSVGAPLETSEDMQHIHLAGAGHPYDPH